MFVAVEESGSRAAIRGSFDEICRLKFEGAVGYFGWFFAELIVKDLKEV